MNVPQNLNPANTIPGVTPPPPPPPITGVNMGGSAPMATPVAVASATAPAAPAMPMMNNTTLPAVADEPVLDSQLPTEDSFGLPIQPTVATVNAPEEKNPVFVNGMLPPETPVEPVANQDKKEKNKVTKAAKADGNENKEGLSPVVMIIVYVIVAVLIGVGVFMLWKYQNDQIVVLRESNNAKNTQIQKLTTDLTGLQDQIATSSNLPVFVEADGKYSFFQKVPGMQVTAAADQTKVTHGEFDGDTIVNGMLMTIELGNTGGVGLSTVVDEEFAAAPEGITNDDLRSEMIADNMGFSYVNLSDEHEKIVYYLHKNAAANEYVKLTYEIKAGSDTEYSNFEKVVLGILNSLKLY